MKPSVLYIMCYNTAHDWSVELSVHVLRDGCITNHHHNVTQASYRRVARLVDTIMHSEQADKYTVLVDRADVGWWLWKKVP